jgi:parvulin-like peptidyl-prolyl isomerase
VAPPPAPANEPPPETVLASFEGRKLTYAELKRFLSVLDPKQQQLAVRNPKPLIHQYFLWQKLAEMALKEKLDESSPTREQIEYNRTYLLMQAKLNSVLRDMKVDEADLKKYYEANKDKYTQVRVKALYISFSNNPEPGAGGKKLLSEEEAKAKIEKILAEIRGGADFVKMVKQNSEDTTSAEKDGDFATIRRSDTVPEPVRAAVFALKQGQVSDPVRQPNGFYLFRAEDITVRSYQQMQIEILEEVRQVKSKEWMDKLNNSVDFKVENEAFFKAAEAPAPAPQSPAAAPPPH